MTYVRLVRFTLSPGRRKVAEAMASSLVPEILEQRGCRGATFFGDHETRQYGLFVLWDSVENADAAAGVIGPRLHGHLEGNVEAPPELVLFEVMAPGRG